MKYKELTPIFNAIFNEHQKKSSCIDNDITREDWIRTIETLTSCLKNVSHVKGDIYKVYLIQIAETAVTMLDQENKNE